VLFRPAVNAIAARQKAAGQLRRKETNQGGSDGI
jgi:hypothetical protein